MNLWSAQSSPGVSLVLDKSACLNLHSDLDVTHAQGEGVGGLESDRRLDCDRRLEASEGVR